MTLLLGKFEGEKDLFFQASEQNITKTVLSFYFAAYSISLSTPQCSLAYYFSHPYGYQAVAICTPMSLRIAFFGSDLFSVASLARLGRLRNETPLAIKSIDVICRPVKPTGRNLKTFTDLPISIEASKQNLPILRVDSGAEISSLPKTYDLVVAVSFGLLIPGSFIHSARFGGLNVHPSLLPTFSGSSPIQHAIMKDCAYTGVTVQTLHPTEFDHGVILRQSEEIDIRNENYQSLQPKLAGIGAELLANVILSGAYVEPVALKSSYTHSTAPKLGSSLLQIQWAVQTSRSIKRHFDALGPLHTNKHILLTKKKQLIDTQYKVILDGIEVGPAEVPGLGLSTPGSFVLHDSKLAIKTVDGSILVSLLKLQYCGTESPQVFVAKLKKRAGALANEFA